jgi:hypothetical protein
MELNQTTLRGILAAVLSVDPKYVVPKQGNWWNPKDKEANIANWCAYQIRRNRPRTAPFYDEGNNNGQKVNGVAVLKLAEIDLQFVGPQSDELAQSVSMWPFRSDVKAEFQKVHGAIMTDEYDAISSHFHQDGANTVMAWNVTIQVLWYSILDSSQGPMPALTLEGNIQKRL